MSSELVHVMSRGFAAIMTRNISIFITKHCGIVSCSLSGGLHPKSIVDSKVWVKKTCRKAAGQDIHCVSFVHLLMIFPLLIIVI